MKFSRHVLAIAIGTLFSGMALAAPSATQMPGGGQVIAVSTGTTVNGGGLGTTLANLPNGSTITLSNTTTTRYNGVAPYAVIRWGGSTGGTPNVADATNPQGFNVGSAAAVTFANGTPNWGSVLNIDASGNASEIDGSLHSNILNFYLANGNGIVIGNGATITAGGQVGLIGWNMDNSTAAYDFAGNNSSGVSYLDFGNTSTPGGITIGSATLNIGSGTSDGSVLLLGGSIVNNGTINISAVNNYNDFGYFVAGAGWVPTKSTDTVNGVSSTPVYRVYSAYQYSQGSFGVVNLVPGTGSYSFTNNGAITVTQIASSNHNLSAVLADSGITNTGSITMTNSPLVLATNPANDAAAKNPTNNPIFLGGTITAPYAGTVPDPSDLVSSSCGFGNGCYSSGTASLAVYAPGSSVTFFVPAGGVYGGAAGATGSVNAPVALLMGAQIQGVNGASPLTTNDLTALVTDRINAPGSTDFLKNGFGINPETTGGLVNVHLYSAAAANNPATPSYVNLMINGDATVDSAGTWSTIATQIDQNYYSGSTSDGNPLSVDGSGNYSYAPNALNNATFGTAASQVTTGGSLIIQATGNMNLVGGTTASVLDGLYSNLYDTSFGSYSYSPYWVGSTSPFVFSGGVVFKAGKSLVVNVPVINAWGSLVIPYQGVFLESPSITVNNQAFFVTGPEMRVNVSSTPTSGTPAVFLENGGSMVQAPSVASAAMGSGVFANTYSTLINAYVNDPATWTSVVNNTPM